MVQRISSLLKNSTGCVIAWMRCQNRREFVGFASRAPHLARVEKNSTMAFFNGLLGDVFLETGEPQLAITHLEAALAHTDQPALRQNVEKKLAQARGASGK
jgi:hypothetical protein